MVSKYYLYDTICAYYNIYGWQTTLHTHNYRTTLADPTDTVLLKFKKKFNSKRNSP